MNTNNLFDMTERNMCDWCEKQEKLLGEKFCSEECREKFYGDVVAKLVEEKEWWDKPLREMNDDEIEMYLELIGRCPREECDELTMDYEGGDILRYSYVNFADKTIADQIVCDITITCARFAGATLTNCVFDNVTFEECDFKSVILENIKFRNSTFVECDLEPYMIVDNSCSVLKYYEENDELLGKCYEEQQQEDELICKYSEQQCQALCAYAQEHDLTVAEAIEYQTSCHSCGKAVEDGIFDEANHQYCGEKCFEYCEDYWYPCFREGNCRVCSISQYHKDRREEEMRCDEV